MLYVPVNIFSVMFLQYPVFLGLTSTKQKIKSLAKGYNTVPLVSLKIGTLDLKPNTLPLSHCGDPKGLKIQYLRLSSSNSETPFFTA